MNNLAINLLFATQTGPYRIRLVFDDSHVQEVDFQPFLVHSHHPEIRAYLEPALFAAFKLAYGELVWGDYQLYFPVMDLYRNTIEHNEMLSEAP